MTTSEATAEVFWTAFKTLRRSEREAVIQRLLSDLRTREDLIDIGTALQREHERGLASTRVRAELKKAGRL